MPFPRNRPWILSWGIGVLIGTIVALVIGAIVINVTQPSTSKFASKCVNIDDDDLDYNFSSSANLFDLKLFSRILGSGNDEENLVLSSFSVASVLSMVYLGSRGETAEELRSLLAFPCGENDTLTEGMYLESMSRTSQNLRVNNSIEYSAKLLEINGNVGILRNFDGTISFASNYRNCTISVKNSHF